MNDFRTNLSDELSVLTAPPLGDLVEVATRRGRRARRIRAVGAAGSVLAVAAVTALLIGPLGTGRPQSPTLLGVAGAPATHAPVAAGTVSSSPSPSAGVGAPLTQAATTGALVDTTGPALLAAVLDALPKSVANAGRSDHYAANDGRDLGAQLYLTGARGTGMIRVFVGDNPTGDLGCSEQGLPGMPKPQCHTGADGLPVKVIRQDGGNCIEDTSVIATHADGSVVQVLISSCLAWNGSANPPGVAALTMDQAVALAQDPSIGRRMDSGFVQTANDRFPGLPAFH